MFSNTPGDSQGITKYHSNQYVNCWNHSRKDKSCDVLCLSEAYEKLLWWFLGFSSTGTNLEYLIEILILNSLTFK